MSQLNDKLINYGNLAEFHIKLLNDLVTSDKATWSSSKISSMIADAGFNVEFVNELPASGDVHTIYFVPSSNPETQNVKDEFMWTGSAWEQVGSTAIDMSPYATIANVDASLALKQNVLSAGQNIAIDASNNISALGYIFDTSDGSYANIYRQDSEDGGQLVANMASGLGAHAEGYSTQASGLGAHAEGVNTTTSNGYGTHAEGVGASASANGAHAEGQNSQASGKYSHAEGANTVASGDFGAHAEGYQTKASYTTVGNVNHGIGAHAEGWSTEAKHDGAHAEGVYTLASEQGAHAEGSGAQNELVQALGIASHAEGVKTIARNRGEHAEGFRNISHTTGSQTEDSSGNTAHSVGVGTNDLRRNAEEIMYNGDMYVFGVGNYDGIHIKGEQGAPAGLQTLQEVVNNKADVYEVATTADIEALFATPEPTPTYPPLNQIWYETSNNQVYDFGTDYDDEPLPIVWTGNDGENSESPLSNVYTNGKGILTFNNDIYAMEDFGNSGDGTSMTKVWLPYITYNTSDGYHTPFKNMLNSQENLTDVYYPGTIDELEEAFYDHHNEQYYGALSWAGTHIIHCSDGDFEVPMGS